MGASSGGAVAAGHEDAHPTAVQPLAVVEGGYRAVLDRVFGVIFAFYTVLLVAQVAISATGRGARLLVGAPNAVQPVMTALLCALLLGTSVQAWRGPLPEPLVVWLLGATASTMLIARLSAGTGLAVDDTLYELAGPGLTAWTVFTRRNPVVVPVLATLVCVGAWDVSSALPAERAVTTLATVVLCGVGARMLRYYADQADAEATRTHEQLAAAEAKEAAALVGRAAARVVHDEVISALTALTFDARQLSRPQVQAAVRRAREALARSGRLVEATLGQRLNEVARATPQLRVSITGPDLPGLPAYVVEAMAAAAAEALRNCERHARAPHAHVEVAGHEGAVQVTVIDDGVGFDRRAVPAASTGLERSVVGRMRDIGGGADVLSAPGRGTRVVLRWSAPAVVTAAEQAPLAWVQSLRVRPPLLFVGYLLPPLVAYACLLVLRWGDFRWPATAVAVYVSLFGFAVLLVRHLGSLALPRPWLVAACVVNSSLALLGALCVRPGAIDAFAFWVGGEGAIAVGVVTVAGSAGWAVACLLLDLVALGTGLSLTGGAVGWVGLFSTLSSPVFAASFALGHRFAFTRMSARLAGLLDTDRQTRARGAIAQAAASADEAALADARQLAGPLLEHAAAGTASEQVLASQAREVSALLRDGLVAPRLMNPHLLEALRNARRRGTSVSIRDETAAVSPLHALAASTLLALLVSAEHELTRVSLTLYSSERGDETVLGLHVVAEPAILAELPASVGVGAITWQDVGGALLGTASAPNGPATFAAGSAIIPPDGPGGGAGPAERGPAERGPAEAFPQAA